MLVNCPRCGFSQPDDRYCAQCGVDMLSVKVKDPSSLQKLFASGVFQIAVLLVIAVTAGTLIIKSNQKPMETPKVTRFQGVNKNVSTQLASNADTEPSPESLHENDNSLSDLQNTEITLSESSVTPAAATKALGTGHAQPSSTTATSTATAAAASKTKTAAETIANNQMPNFKIMYLEIPIEVLNRWASDSLRSGLFQNLNEYSAGILTDFRKRTDLQFQTLKSTDRKLSPGQSDTNLSGTMSEDGTKMIGLAAKVDLRSVENGTVHGTLTVTRTAKQSRENYPAEFDLPQGAVFFLVGAIKRQQFANEMNLLTMPPFQILHSNDFRSQKSEFVIVVEPEFR